MKAEIERSYRISVPTSEDADDWPDHNSTDYCRCTIDNINLYDRFIVFTILFEDNRSKDYILGRYNHKRIWYFDTYECVGSELYEFHDLNGILDEISCSDADYDEEEALLTSAAVFTIFNDYGCYLEYTSAQDPTDDKELPF